MLLSSLKILPPHWPLTLVNGNKQPLGKNWQRNPYTRSEAIAVFRRGYLTLRGKKGSYRVKPLGIGLLCGHNAKEFLFAIDCDLFHFFRPLAHLNVRRWIIKRGKR